MVFLWILNFFNENCKLNAISDFSSIFFPFNGEIILNQSYLINKALDINKNTTIKGLKNTLFLERLENTSYFFNINDNCSLDLYQVNFILNYEGNYFKSESFLILFQINRNSKFSLQVLFIYNFLLKFNNRRLNLGQTAKLIISK